jgi:ABC-type proline/glycine betaine transport system permease subunit
MAVGPFRDKRDFIETNVFVVAMACIQIGSFLALYETGYLSTAISKVAFVLIAVIASVVVGFAFSVAQERRTAKRIGGK